MNIIEKSLEIALRAYSGKTDKAGEPYILHPLRVMASMDTKEEMAVALLHDVIEDSDITKEQLLGIGIPPRIADAVQVLTKREDESYEQFIDRILEDPLATKIKKADIDDNMNVLRLKSITQKDLNRVAKYHVAWNRPKNTC